MASLVGGRGRQADTKVHYIPFALPEKAQEKNLTISPSFMSGFKKPKLISLDALSAGLAATQFSSMDIFTNTQVNNQVQLCINMR